MYVLVACMLFLLFTSVLHTFFFFCDRKTGLKLNISSMNAMASHLG